jgi:hypothetical protein
MLKVLIGGVKTGSKTTLIDFLALKNITIYATTMYLFIEIEVGISIKISAYRGCLDGRIVRFTIGGEPDATRR